VDVPQDRLLPFRVHLDPRHLVPPALRPADARFGWGVLLTVALLWFLVSALAKALGASNAALAWLSLAGIAVIVAILVIRGIQVRSALPKAKE